MTIVFVIPPGRKINGLLFVQSIIVDSSPTIDLPPSKTISLTLKYKDNSSITSSALVGDTLLNLLALGAAIPKPPNDSNSSSKEIAQVLFGTLTPTFSCPPVMKSLANLLRGQTKVNGPGQELFASFIA